MNVEWLPDALLDLEKIYAYIAEDNPAAAESQIRKVHRQVGNLAKRVSRKGKMGRVPGTMELVILNSPFIAVYRVVYGRYQVLRILHTSLSWPSTFK